MKKSEVTSSEVAAVAGRGIHACKAVPRSSGLFACVKMSDGRLMYVPAGVLLGDLRKVCASALTQVGPAARKPRG